MHRDMMVSWVSGLTKPVLFTRHWVVTLATPLYSTSSRPIQALKTTFPFRLTEKMTPVTRSLENSPSPKWYLALKILQACRSWTSIRSTDFCKQVYRNLVSSIHQLTWISDQHWQALTDTNVGIIGPDGQPIVVDSIVPNVPDGQFVAVFDSGFTFRCASPSDYRLIRLTFLPVC